MLINWIWFITSLTIIATSISSHTIHLNSTMKNFCKRFTISNRPSQDCSSKNLTILPLLYNDIISLNLDNNSFTIIEKFPENYRNLYTLRLSSCSIRKISTQALLSLKSVRVLDLSHNQLQNISFGYGRLDLTTLNLAHNAIKYLPDLSSLQSLRVIDLSNNQIHTVIPNFLPANVESFRLTANNITHLTQWPTLTKLQELDVSFNPLRCDCPLWEFVEWAKNLALFQDDILPCQRPKTLRQSVIFTDQMICGPEINSAQIIERTTISFGRSHRMCCLISSHPKPNLWWQHILKNISTHTTQHVVVLKEFHVSGAHQSLILNSSTNILFYFQFSIGLFIFVFCCAVCCILSRGRARKTTLEWNSRLPHIMDDYPTKLNNSNGDPVVKCNNLEHYHHLPANNYLNGLTESGNVHFKYSTAEYSCSEKRKSNQLSYYLDDNQRRITLWRHRIAAMRAPLAQFDNETNIMTVLHTPV